VEFGGHRGRLPRNYCGLCLTSGYCLDDLVSELGAGADELAEATGPPVAAAEELGCEAGVEVRLEGGVAGAAEQQLGEVTGLGAETPAMPEPRPSFCSVGASSLPFASMPFADWNF